MPEWPSGTVTFLFTDIEGSTALWERDRAAMAVAVERHLRLLRTAIEDHGGVLFKVMGDAVQAAFATAPTAVAAAADAQRALLSEDWHTADPLRVRMALHAGEAEPRDGDYLTAPLNRLSRLLVTGYGAQILLTQAVQQLCRDALPAGVTLRDLGEHRLRDLLQPEQIFQLVHPDLPTEFPPLKSLDVRPHNLPLQPTPFLGREREVAEIVGLLRRPEIRLLTLTGAGGTGKSRLALQVAAELLDDFADGVFFVALAPLTDPALVPVAIAGALGVPEAGEHTLVERLRQVLANQQVLVVLDNVEHLVEAVPTVGELLGSVPGLKILATSRVPLRLRAEHEYPVSPLGLPPRQPPPRPEQVAQYEAARLFIARAQAVNPAFAVDSENAQAIAEICYRLDGLPLAIELAATRIRMLPPQALLARLERRLPLLATGARDAPARQRTLRDAIAWSYDLLEPAEQILFGRLAIFVGGATLEAVERMANVEGDLDVFGGLERLVEHNLVRQEQGADGEPRFTMLETIREFGLERLGEGQEGEMLRCRHAEFYARLAAEAEPVRMLPEQGPWVVRLDTEHPNLRAALSWLLDSGDPDLGLRMAAALGWFWHLRGHFGEGRTWLERALTANPHAAAIDRAKALFSAAHLALYQGDEKQALAFGEESLALYRTIGDRTLISRALNVLGIVTEDRGEFDRAAALFEEALVLHRADDDRTWTAHALRHLGLVTYGRGDLERAAALIEEALALNRELKLTWGATVSLIYLGVIACERGDVRRSGEAYAEALTLAREQGSRQGIARGLVGVATLAALSDQSAVAARLFGASDAICTALGYRFGLPERAQYDRARAANRSALGDEAFVTAWEAGRVLPDDEAIAESLAVVAFFVGRSTARSARQPAGKCA